MIDQFVQLFGGQTFRYCDELFAVLSTDSVKVTRSCDAEGSRGNQTCKHYERTYRHRSEHLERRHTGEPYWDELRLASNDLCDGLADMPDSPCCMWRITSPSNLEYVAFENTDSNTIVGCLRFDTSMRPPR